MTRSPVNLNQDGTAQSPNSRRDLIEGYRTEHGVMYLARVEDLLDSDIGRDLKGRVQLIFTSPPFPLNRKKRYGNLLGDAYLEWIEALAPRLTRLLAPRGSIVIELGNAWEAGKPTMSTLGLEALLAFKRSAGLHLCQQFICHNPARLPSPAQWVNVKRIRVKDSFTHVWWMSPTEWPKADNKRVLVPYSQAMKQLLRNQRYNSGMRPSGHDISPTAFLKDNGGAIPANVLTISNTRSGDPYRQHCKQLDVKVHPAPMQPELVEFFVKLLTDQHDLVLDPFGGSNTTGAVAEQLGRCWVATEPDDDYVDGSRGRFPNPGEL